MLVTGLIFLILGILIKFGKMYFLIAGYNTMSEEEKKKYDIQGIANVFWNAMFGMVIVIFTGYLVANWLENFAIHIFTFWIAILIGIPYLLIASNSKKHKKNEE